MKLGLGLTSFFYLIAVFYSTNAIATPLIEKTLLVAKYCSNIEEFDDRIKQSFSQDSDKELTKQGPFLCAASDYHGDKREPLGTLVGDMWVALRGCDNKAHMGELMQMREALLQAYALSGDSMRNWLCSLDRLFVEFSAKSKFNAETLSVPSALIEEVKINQEGTELIIPDSEEFTRLRTQYVSGYHVLTKKERFENSYLTLAINGRRLSAGARNYWAFYSQFQLSSQAGLLSLPTPEKYLPRRDALPFVDNHYMTIDFAHGNQQEILTNQPVPADNLRYLQENQIPSFVSLNSPFGSLMLGLGHEIVHHMMYVEGLYYEYKDAGWNLGHPLVKDWISYSWIIPPGTPDTGLLPNDFSAIDDLVEQGYRKMYCLSGEGSEVIGGDGSCGEIKHTQELVDTIKIYLNQTHFTNWLGALNPAEDLCECVSHGILYPYLVDSQYHLSTIASNEEPFNFLTRMEDMMIGKDPRSGKPKKCTWAMNSLNSFLYKEELTIEDVY